MSYIINADNFSMFAKQLTKNLKEKNPSLKLSEVQEAISKTIGFNNLHCAKKQNFNKEKDLICLTPFNNSFSQIDLALKTIEYKAKNFGYIVISDIDNLLVVVSNATIANLILNKEQPQKYKLILSKWIIDTLDEVGRAYERVDVEELFSIFFSEIKKERRKSLLNFILNKLEEESNNQSDMESYLIISQVKRYIG